MNKKKLSVVMAGAMLASAVSPVLAYTVDTDSVKKYEVNGSNKGILIRDLRNLLTSKVFANETINQSTKGQSVYNIIVDGTQFYNVTDVKALEEAIQNATTGKKIIVEDRGHMEYNGKYYHYAVKDIEGVDATFDATELQNAYDEWVKGKDRYPAVYEMSYNKTEKVLTVKTRAAASETEHLTLTYKEGDKQVDFTDAIDSNGDSTLDLAKVVGFKVKKDNSVAKDDEIDGKRLAEITISDVDASYEVALSKLYDGLFLTEDGQKLLDTIKEYKANKSEGYVANVAVKVEDEANGIYSVRIALVNGKTKEKTEITVKSNNRAQLDLFRKFMYNAKANVEVLAGDNRYETAVKVAKENAGIEDVAKNGNIVLVNGDALVDGLAAAPLAAAVWNKNYQSGNEASRQRVAPILLTESDSLPKATKDYIKELIAEQQVGKLNQVTVYLVGGTSVISKSVENQLKEAGLRIVRAGGANREETSLKVAEIMAKDGDIISGNENNNNGTVGKVDLSHAFVVGAEGEADAMSIAPVAAEKGNPIIVSKKGGLSEDAIDSLNGWKNTANDTNNTTDVTIIGGETAVSKETEKALVDAKIDVERVAGSNRQETNAKVIEKYAHVGLNKLVVSKDGKGNNSELIDALTATSLAVKDKAPIVLGTNKLSTAQINAIEKKANRNGVKSGVYVYQVGYGVARDVVKTIAERVGLAK